MTVHVPEPTVVAAAELAPVRTTCPYCGVGCGVARHARRAGGVCDRGRSATIPRISVGFARKARRSARRWGSSGRLLHPMIGGGRRASWDDALDGRGGRLRAASTREHGPDAVAFYLSGQLLTEDYYVANKLMKGFFGSSQRRHQFALVHGLVGCRPPPRFRLRHRAGLLRGPRRGRSPRAGRLERGLVPSRPVPAHAGQSPARAARSIVSHRSAPHRDRRRAPTSFSPIARHGRSAVLRASRPSRRDRRARPRLTSRGTRRGSRDALAQARAIAPESRRPPPRPGSPPAEVARFLRPVPVASRTVVTLYSQGVNQSAQGTDKVNAIINCHLATGRIGRPGMGPFSLTGQPNAMGGREVGGLANMLAAHMGFSAPEVDRVRRFWKAPRIAEREGHKAVAMFEAIARGRHQGALDHGHQPGRVPAATPTRSAPRCSKLDLLVVSENVLSNDSIARRRACLLPAAAWGEKDGTVTNSERRISRQRAFLPAPGEAKPDWWIVSEVARRMGFADAFAYSVPGRDLRRARGALRVRERRQPRFRHRRPRGAFRRGLRHPGAGAVAAGAGR